MYRNTILQSVLNRGWFGDGANRCGHYFLGLSELPLVTIALIMTAVRLLFLYAIYPRSDHVTGIMRNHGMVYWLLCRCLFQAADLFSIVHEVPHGAPRVEEVLGSTT